MMTLLFDRAWRKSSCFSRAGRECTVSNICLFSQEEIVLQYISTIDPSGCGQN